MIVGVLAETQTYASGMRVKANVLGCYKKCNLNPKKSIKQNIPRIFYLYHFKT
jgi:hypothetical protein